MNFVALKRCRFKTYNNLLVMKAQKKDRSKQTIWQVKGIDYLQKHAHLYWMQLYKHFYLLNYLSAKQKITIIRDLSESEGIYFDGDVPKLKTGKIFKLVERQEYFLLQQSRIPTVAELYSYQNENTLKQCVDKTQFQKLQNRLSEESHQITKNGYYESKTKRTKSFSIYKINFKAQSKFKFEDYVNGYKNSIQVQFYPFQDSSLSRFQINILIKPLESPKEISFNQLFPNEKEFTRSLLQIPLESKPLLSESNYITYNFQQPQEERYIEIQQPHLALAFQGGGVKGISYVGVYNQISRLQQSTRTSSDNKLSLPIKSIIGSSAGGILSLIFTAGIKESELFEHCLMMDSFLQDVLIQTVQQGQRAQKNPQAQFNKKNVIPIKAGYFSGQADQLKNTLHDLGLLEDSLFQILIKTLKQPSLQDKLIKILNPLLGPSASFLLTFKQYNKNQQVIGQQVNCCCCGFSCCCCNKTVKDVRLINYYGLLYMALMTGDSIENLAALVLVFFLRKAANQQNQKFQRKFDIFLKRKNVKSILIRKAVLQQAEKVIKSYMDYKQLKEKLKKAGKRILKSQITYIQLPLMKFAKSITMKDFYLLTEVEFTCTSVDLNDRIERFFNHKTSPQLPVCKAVQMTGSFPVAFQSLRWKRDWGYYYIHHENTRRQINLQGHNFTDGGLLANFPIRYLDNEEFRPMYFSHKLNSNTVLYGFGLEELQDFPENKPKQELAQAINSFKKEFLLRVTPKILKYLICCSSPTFYESPEFQLINFLLSLVSAMQHSDRRLNIECFQPKIIHTKIPPQNEMLIESSKLLKKIQNFQNILKEFRYSAQKHFKQQYSEIMYEQLKALKQMVFLQKKTEFSSIKEARKLIECQIGPNGIFTSAFECYKKMLKDKNVCHRFENNEEVFLDEEYSKELKQFFVEFEQSVLKKQVNISLVKNDCSQWCKQVGSTIQLIKKNLKSTEKEGDFQKAVYLREEILKKLMNARYRFTPFINKLYRSKFTSTKEKISLKKISINYFAQTQIYKRYYEISGKVQKIINQKINHHIKQCKKNKKDISTLDLNLHVVLEAFSLSHYYYPQMIQILQRVLTNINNQRRIQFSLQQVGWKNLTIDIISCTEFHAIYGVCYVLGLGNSQIKQRMSQMKSLFYPRKNLNQKFKSQHWLKTSLSQLQALLKRQWDQKFDLIRQEQQLQALNQKQFQQQLINCELNQDFMLKYKFSQADIINHLQKILHYVSFSFEQLNKLQPRKRKSRISQLLNLNVFKEQNQKYEKKGKMFLLDLMSHFAEQLIVVSQYIMKTQTFVNIKEKSENDDRFFKGMILKSLISAFQYKKYIYKLLISKGLNPNITLQNFYHLAQKKILLNFTCIKVNQGRFQLVNMHTKPNMPLWAALMAAASLPFLLGNFTGRQQWQIDQRITSLKKAKATAFFNKLEKVDYTSSLSSYISGNFISTLPIQVLSNSKVIQKKLLKQTEDKKSSTRIIELCFAFESQKQSQKTYDAQNLVKNVCNALKGKTKFINCWDLCKYFCEFLCSFCCSAQGISWYLSDKFNQSQVKKLLNMRLNSNDNFIYRMYQRYLIKLPVRFGTLQFDKITIEKPYLKDTIRQAQQVVRQLTDAINVKDNKIVFQKFAKQTSLEVSYVAINNQNPQNSQNKKIYYYRIKFLSHTIWRKLSGKYITYYKIGQINDFKCVQTDYFDIDQAAVKNNTNIYLKFVYCSPESYKIKERTHVVNLSHLSFLSQHKYQQALTHLRAIFRFSYRSLLINVRNNPLRGEWAGVSQINIQIPQTKQKRLVQIESERGLFQRGNKVNQVISFPLPQYPQLSIVTQISNKKSTMFCLNESCQRQKLIKSIDPYRQRGQCATCHSQMNLIVMDCRKCQSKYCLHCKIQNFVVIKAFKEPSNAVICCTQRHSFKVEDNQSSLNLCLYCNKYFDYLWQEKCGMAICSNCLIYIPENEIQDFVEEQNSL